MQRGEDWKGGSATEEGQEGQAVRRVESAERREEAEGIVRR